MDLVAGHIVKRGLTLSLLLFLAVLGSAEEKAGNRLAQEKSPYLLQHAHNPVDWYPWGPEAFEKARQEDKPILLSVGYSTCHWCHVMERESFEDKDIAAYLNKHFVSIKLDREERPDVDAVYMKSFQAMFGQGGGWPLNVFLTGELKLFYGGTYFPPQSRQGRPSFQKVLEGIERAWREDKEAVLQSANELGKQLALHLEEGRGSAGALDASVVKKAVASLAADLDVKEGGWGTGPKFPQPSHLMLVLTSADEEARKKALFTCRKMANGGIHDRLVGGFHRYSTDGRWLVPHFEKMLYDQAQLLEVYCEAWRLSREPLFREAACGIADYIIAEMQHPDGAYWSAQDAQSEGKEGKAWCWTTAELKGLLSSEEQAVVKRVFGLTEKGNFSDFSDPEALKNLNVLSIVEAPGTDEKVFVQAVAKMKKVRAKRVPAMTDDKVLAGWNGLMIAAMAEAGLVFDESRYLASAERAFADVTNKLWDGKRLANRWRDGHVEVSQQAINYLAMAKAGRQLYETTLKSDYLTQALQYLDGGRQRFFDKEKGGFFDGEEREDLVMRLKDDYDSAMPTASSLGVQELLWFAEITGRADLAAETELTLRYFGLALREEAFALPGMQLALRRWNEKPARLVIVGAEESVSDFVKLAWQDGRGDLLVMGNTGPVSEFTRSLKVEEGTMAFYCEGMTCREPSNDPETIATWLREAAPEPTVNE